MSDLFSSLTSAAHALEAQRLGLDVTGQNIANVNTPGYSRRVVDFAAIPPDTASSAGRGVDVVGIRAMRDRLIERRLEQEIGFERREAAAAEALAVVESSLGAVGQSIDARLEELFDSFSRLAEAPTSAVSRQEVVTQGDALARSLRDMSGRLRSAQRDADTRIRSAVEEVNSLAARIADINDSLGSLDPQASLHLQDEQAMLVRQLSELVDIGVLSRPEGGVDVSFATGRPLVVGEHPYTIDVQSSSPYGLATLSSVGVDVTKEITGGTIGGLLRVRDVNIEDYLGRLDDLAMSVATAVNDLHTAGYDQNLAAGAAFFEFTRAIGDPPRGAAEAIVMNADIVSDPRLIAAAGSPVAGGNGIARQLAALSDTPLADGSTLTENWSQLVYRIGRDTQAASDEQQNRDEVVEQVERLRDQVSGVSLDEEAMMLMKFQRAYEANARFFRAIDQALDILFESLGR